MRAVIQRVEKASVSVEDEIKGQVGAGFLALPQMAVEGTAGVYVLEVLFLLGNCVLIMLMTRWLTGGKGNILCVAAGLTLLLKTCGQHCYCEEFDYFFMLLGFAVIYLIDADRAHIRERGHHNTYQNITGFRHYFPSSSTSISNTKTELGGICPTGRFP